MLVLSVVEQGLVKLRMLVVEHHSIRQSAEFVRSVFAMNRACGEMNAYRILLAASERMVLVVKVMMAAIGVMCMSFVGYPIILYALTGKKVLILPVFMPFDETTSQGFATMTAFHLVWVIQILVGLTAVDITLILSTINIVPMVELFDNLFGTLNDGLRRNLTISETHEVRQCVTNLMKMHQEMCM